MRYNIRQLLFPGYDVQVLPPQFSIGSDPQRNPALSYLKKVVPQILEGRPSLIAVALVHPTQIMHTLVLGSLLREAGFSGWLVLYGSYEDVLSPEDMAPDLIDCPEHTLFRWFDGVFVGEAETGLAKLTDALHGKGRMQDVPNLLSPSTGCTAPSRFVEDLAAHPIPDFSWVKPDLYPYPTPVIDLRLGRGCPWGRCAFCAIQAHQVGYRSDRASRIAAAMQQAHNEIGTRFFRLRDDLLTPRQLLNLSKAFAELSFRPRWSARARFEPTLSRRILQEAAEAGLEELWLGLESISESVRKRMNKGVKTPEIERIVREASGLGIRVRALCMLGYPGESEADARATLSWLTQRADLLWSYSLTPFQLMRRSPLGQNPASAGLTLLPDPIEQAKRLRFQLAFHADNTLPPATIQGLMREAAQRIQPHYGPWLGPDLAHDWIRSSIQRSGPPTSFNSL